MAGFKTSKKPLVSLIIVTYNSSVYIKNCLDSLLKVSYKPLEIIILDSGSSDNTLDILEKYKNKIKLIISKDNIGYAGGCNRASKEAKGKYLFFLNPDTVVKKDFLEPLVKKIESEDKIAVCQPLVYLFKSNRINLSGKVTSYIGFDWVRDFDKKTYTKSYNISSFSGSAVLIKKEIFLELGGYDEQYFMYYEDTDLSWRLRLMGYKIVFAPKSKVYHDYKFETDENYLSMKKKYYLNEKNRLMTVLKNYSKRTLILLLPVFIFTEVGLLFYALFKGFLLNKLKAYIFILRKRDGILQKRKLIQKTRVVSDKNIVSDFAPTLGFIYGDNLIVKYLINPILYIYWKMVGGLI